MVHIYVVNMVITGNEDKAIQDLRFFSSEIVFIKDLRNLKYFLGIEVPRSELRFLYNRVCVHLKFLLMMDFRELN